MKNFFEELRKNGLAPILMSGCAGFLIGTIVMGFVFHSWELPKRAESVITTEITTGKTAASSITDKEAAKAELERGCEIEGTDAINDIPPEFSTSETEVDTSDWEFHPNYDYHDDDYRDEIYHDIEFDEGGEVPEVVSKDKERLAKKLTTIDSKYEWKSVKADLDGSGQNLGFKHTFSAEDLEDTDIPLDTWKDSDGTCTTVYVPAITVDGKATTMFGSWGVLLVTNAEKDGSRNFTTAELYIYDKSTVDSGNHPLTYMLMDSGSVRITGPTLDMVNLYLSSSDYKNDPYRYTAEHVSRGGFGWSDGGYSDSEIAGIEFTNHSINLTKAVAKDFLDFAYDELHARSAHEASKLFNKDKTEFDMLTWIDPEEGYVIDKQLFKLDDETYYIKGEMPSNYVITLQSDKIIVGVGACSCLNLGEDRLYNGLYFEDKTKNPEMVKIKGTDLILTRDTLDHLIYLLEDSGTNWWALSAQSANLID